MNDTSNLSHQVSHELLWDKFRAGDQEAFGKLALHYYQLLYNYGLNLNRDDEFISDCIQELFLELWERRAFLSRTDFVKTYLLKALRNKIFKESIRLKRFKEPRDVPFEVGADISIESHIVLKEEETAQIRQLNSVLNTLTKRQREIVYLRFYQGLEFDEISHVMGLTRQSVANLLHRTLKKIKESWTIVLFIAAFLNLSGR
ncbi:RNA polymerase sigma factor [Larkinella harenae]